MTSTEINTWTDGKSFYIPAAIHKYYFVQSSAVNNNEDAKHKRDVDDVADDKNNNDNNNINNNNNNNDNNNDNNNNNNDNNNDNNNNNIDLN